MGMESKSKITGAAIAWMLAMAGCGTTDEGDSTGTATEATTDSSGPDSMTEPTTSVSMSESESETDTPMLPCNGGLACGEEEFCSSVSQSCDCDSNFDYCDLTSTPAGCYAVPTACAILESPDRESCISANACRIGGTFVDGTLECETYEECSGDCDYDPAGCVDTSGMTGADSGSSDSGSSDSGSSGDDSSSTG